MIRRLNSSKFQIENSIQHNKTKKSIQKYNFKRTVITLGSIGKNRQQVQYKDSFMKIPYDVLSPLEEEKKDMHPEDIKKVLDETIIGQEEAKKAIAVAMRNRWRFKKLPKDIQKEIIPKNILMSGPTGVGKTEIARRVSKITHSPFIKVEATKYTEVGFRGEDVDSIIKSLMNSAFAIEKEKFSENAKKVLDDYAIDFLLKHYMNIDPDISDFQRQRATLHKSFKEGLFDEATILKTGTQVFKLGDIKRNFITGALDQLLADHQSSIIERAKNDVEQEGIVFIDEIDKLCSVDPWKPDSSDEGVQRDLLPIVEGSKVKTNHGDIDTSNILFIASGAFHQSKVTDLLAEFLGRFPIRVKLQPLKEEDMYKILTEPPINLIVQHTALLKTEELDIRFSDESLHRIAFYATKINETMEDIGARRLYSVMETLMDDFQFNTDDYLGKTIVIDESYVNEKLNKLLEKEEKQHYIL